MPKKKNGKSQTKKRRADTKKPGREKRDNADRLLRAASDVKAFRRAVSDAALTPAQRVTLVEQAQVLFEQFYAHLPLKEAMHAVDPIQRLKLLKVRLTDIDTDLAFHNELTAIFNSVRDLHTNYLLPEPFSEIVAVLPFQVEAYWKKGQRKYLVTHVVSNASDSAFKAGVEVTHWNGVPIETAVMRVAERHAGSNPAARHARGVVGLTVRPLVRSLPPDEDWVVVGYRAGSRTAKEHRTRWFYLNLPPESDAEDSDLHAVQATRLGLDIEAEMVRRTTKHLYAASAVEAEESPGLKRRARFDTGLDWDDPGWDDPGWDSASRGAAAGGDAGRTHRAGAAREWNQAGYDEPGNDAPGYDRPGNDVPGWLYADSIPVIGRQARKRGAVNQGAVASVMPTVFDARAVRTRSGTFGYIRIRTFSVDSARQFVLEFARLAALLPQNGLIIDVRDNGGGLITAGESLLQLLTPRRIEPERLQFINTPATLELCRNHVSSRHLRDFDLGPWVASIAEATRTGATFSRGFPITSEAMANRIGQTYHGPVVLVTDARCYSTTDIFAAGFHDHDIGTILGVDANTGAGGANVWTHDLLDDLFTEPDPPRNRMPSSPFATLPNGAGMRVSIRRNIRVGRNAGTPLEDLGVKPDEMHDMTRDDLMKRNKDLIEAAGKILKRRKAEAVTLVATVGDVEAAGRTVSVETANLSRLDVYLDTRPVTSIDVADGVHDIAISARNRTSVLDLRGFRDERLVAARRLVVRPS